MMSLTEQEIKNLIIIERVAASVSVFGTLVLLTTFIFIKEFRTLPNTLLFWASFANLFANTAALIGGSALGELSSPLCQFQAFLLEMFMQSDPLWSLAMAVDVYLVVIARYDAIQIKRLTWIYGVICYGVPSIPAVVCLVIRVEGKPQIYGNATLWCWIDDDWASIRIYSYYAPVWLCILLSLLIYLRVGVEIFQIRSQLKAAGNSDLSRDLRYPEQPFTGLRTTEINLTRQQWRKELKSTISDDSMHRCPRKSSKDIYSITITAKNTIIPHRQVLRQIRLRPYSVDKIKWTYCKTSMLFAVSILITWVPASINRIYGLRHPDRPSYVLNIGSAIVLPLQGFWNTIIYFTTSMHVCRRVFARLKGTKKKSRSCVPHPESTRDRSISDSMAELSDHKKRCPSGSSEDGGLF